jgi:hypothetical protein
MTWANIDDGFPRHPKIFPLSDPAFRLHVSGICHASAYRTDGNVPDDILNTLVPRYRQKTLEELARHGLWLPGPDGWQIHDFLEWNRSRAEIEADKERKRKQRSEAGRRGAEVRWKDRES